jgi:hypothetical protein
LSDSDQGISLVTPADCPLRKHPGKLGQNAKSCDKNTTRIDPVDKARDTARDTTTSIGDYNLGKRVLHVSRPIAAGQQISSDGENIHTDSRIKDIWSQDKSHSVHVTIMEGGESVVGGGEIPQQSASPHEPEDPRDDTDNTESFTTVSDSEKAQLSSIQVNLMESSSSAINTPVTADQVLSEENIDPEEAVPSDGASSDSETQKSSLNDSLDPLSLSDLNNMDKTQTVEEECSGTTQADINSSEMAENSSQNGNIATFIDDDNNSKVLAPLACEEGESDDQTSECDMENTDNAEKQVEDGIDGGDMALPKPSSVPENTDNESDTEMTCLDDMGTEGQWDSYAETDFTEDSERTFVMNTDVDDDILEEPVAEPYQSPISSGKHDQGNSIEDKLNMISQSSVLSGRVSLKTMLDQRQKCDVVQIQDLSPIIEDPTSPFKLVPDETVDKPDTNPAPLDLEPTCPSTEEPKEPFEVVTLEIPITLVTPSQEEKDIAPQDESITKLSSGSTLPVTTVQSRSMVAILDVAGVEEELDMSTLERKRKRAKSEEKTASSRGIYAETEVSQQDVDEAVKKLRQVIMTIV